MLRSKRTRSNDAGAGERAAHPWESRGPVAACPRRAASSDLHSMMIQDRTGHRIDGGERLRVVESRGEGAELDERELVLAAQHVEVRRPPRFETCALGIEIEGGRFDRSREHV